MKRAGRQQSKSEILDRFIDLAKWPVGLLALALLPTTVWASLRVIIGEFPSSRYLAFIAGAGGYILLARWLSRVRIFGTFFSTLEHELTHALVAVLTFHRVLSIRSSWRNGGHIRILGRGNWLITIAPYFLPTISVLLLPVVWFAPFPTRFVILFAYGASWGYHAWSTVQESHRGQTDLKKVGWIFCWVFLPTANLVTMVGTFAFAIGGWGGLKEFLLNCVPGV